MSSFFWGGLRCVIVIRSWNDFGKKDYVRLLASARALSSYVIILLVKLKMD